MSNYTEQDLEIDFRKEVGVSWEVASTEMKFSWLAEKVIKHENDKRVLKNLFTDGK